MNFILQNISRLKKINLKVLVGFVFYSLFQLGCEICEKFMLFTKSKGCDDNADERYFNKGLYVSVMMSVGMTLLLPIYFCSKLLGFRKDNHSRRIVDCALLIIPAVLDLLGTIVATYSLYFINISIAQMLGGGVTIFSALLSFFVMKKKATSYQWVGIVLCSLSIGLVGVSLVFGASGVNKSIGYQFLGVFLLLLAQLIMSVQMIVEKYFLSDLKIPILLVVGIKGVYELIVSVFVLMPLLFFIPGSDGSEGVTWWKKSMGHLEDTYDTVCMLAHNPKPLLTASAVEVLITVLNYSIMLVAQQTSAVMRTMFLSLTTFLLWLIEVLIFYVFKSTQYGEGLTPYSSIELAGFIFFVLSLFVYNGAIKLRCLPCVHYEEEAVSVPECKCERAGVNANADANVSIDPRTDATASVFASASDTEDY